MISVQDRIPATVAITKIRAVRGTSNEVVGPTKSGRIRWLTLGPTTATLWWEPVIRWRQRSDIGDRFGPWLFPARTRPHDSADTSSLGHWFAVLCSEAGHPDVTPHRLRHTVATTSVPRGDNRESPIPAAQYRLGHRNAAHHAVHLRPRHATDRRRRRSNPRPALSTPGRNLSRSWLFRPRPGRRKRSDVVLPPRRLI